MLQKIIKIFLDKQSTWKMLLTLVTILIGGWMLATCNRPFTRNRSAIYREQQLKPIEAFTFQDNVSTYDKFIEEKQHGKNRRYHFDPRVKVIQGGGQPLRLLYKAKKEEVQGEQLTTNSKKVSRKASVLQKEASQEPVWSYGVTNPESIQESHLFKARIQERQPVYDGKPIKIVLLEPIPALSLAAGTTLRGPATFLSSARIKIHITAAEGSRRKIALDCFDAEDLQEGIFHDELARQVEEYAQEGIIDELLELDFKGQGIAQKAHKLTRIARKITLEEGKEIFVALPMQKKKD